MSAWLTLACIVHCIAVPIVGLFFAGAATWHDSIAMRIAEVAVIGAALMSALRPIVLLSRRGMPMLSACGALSALGALAGFVWDSHGLLIASLLALAAFQWRAHRALHRCRHER